MRSVSQGNGGSLKYELRKQSSAVALQYNQIETSVQMFFSISYRLLGSYINIKLIRRKPAFDNQGNVCLTLL